MTNEELKKTLWDAANKLRGSVSAAEYKYPVLGLVFLMPFLGWLLLFWTLISGVGAWALAGRAVPQRRAVLDTATVATVITAP